MSTNTEIDRSTGTGAPRTDGGTTVSNMVAAESPLHPDPPGHTSSLGAPANTTTSGDATKDAIRSFVTGSVNFQTPEIKTTGSSYTPYDPTGPSGPTTTPGIAQALLRTALQAQNKELSQQVQALIQRLKIRKEPANEPSTPEEDFPNNKLTLTKAQVYKEIQQTVSEQEHFDGATAASGKGRKDTPQLHDWQPGVFALLRSMELEEAALGIDANVPRSPEAGSIRHAALHDWQNACSHLQDAPPHHQRSPTVELPLYTS